MADHSEVYLENHRRYTAALHAVQSAVKFDIEYDPTGAAGNPKHLRVGINSILVDHGALAHLLIERGVFTEDEYMAALATYAEREQVSVVQGVREKYGLPDTVKFG